MAEHGFRVHPDTLTTAADQLGHTAADLKTTSRQLDDIGKINAGASTDGVTAVIREIHDRAAGVANAMTTHADSLRQAHHWYTTYDRGCAESIRGLVKDEP